MNRANIILLRLAAAVYPALLAGVIVILTRPHPLPKLIGFLSGGLAISIGAGIAIVKRLVATGALTRSSHSSRPIADSVEIAIGAASLLIAWAIWTGHIKRNPFRRKQPTPNQANKPNIAIRALSRGSVAMALAAGMLLNLPGAGYLAALTEIARARPSTAQALAAIVVFNLIMFALAELAIIAYVGEPPRATERVNTLSSLAHQHSRPIWVRIVKLVLGVLSSCSPRRSGGGVYEAAASLSCPDG